MLECYRVLDLSDEKGALCARVMADFGADTIKVERPGGDSSRKIGPFYKDVVDPEKSLHWFAFNRNKKSITLDIKTPEGQEIFKKLVKKADVIIESYDPGVLESCNLDYLNLKQINPNIILTSITNFGQKGPYRNYKGSDLVLWAISGMMYVTGEPDEPPLAPSYPHSYLFGAMQAAIGTMIALYHRRIIGRGQHVDTSAQMALTWVTQPDLVGLYEWFGKVAQRAGRIRVQPFNGIKMPILWECQDGHVAYALIFGSSFSQANRALSEWILSEAPPIVEDRAFQLATISPERLSEEQGAKITNILSEFFRRHTKKYLFEGCLERGIQLYPAMSPMDTLVFEQLQERGYW